jgi:DNA-binding transcriptional LysR family regulator
MIRRLEGVVDTQRTMELHQIRYFLAICLERNFTRAAKRCDVAQPSLTRAVKRLEQELGGALFLRGRGGTSLTELGRLVKPSLEQAYACVQDAAGLALYFREPARDERPARRAIRRGVPGAAFAARARSGTARMARPSRSA